ncbi:sensor histidine kinase [Archangium violaceum]|uniref:sensor histidine kinase n=1 Tax=Archangium violaceum TaxID=83451 RepID=UPI00069614C6|nr:ATP-binding protein [Archangium violaceum]
MRLLVLLLLGLITLPAGASEQVKTVLFFVPEDATVPAIADLTQGFQRTMTNEGRGSVVVNIEYLDMGWFESTAYERALRDFFLVKYRERRPEVIVVYADATPFVLKLQQELWPRVPLFSIYNDAFLVDTLPRSPSVKGNWADLDIPGTVRAALELLPDTRHVALVLGSSLREVAAWDYVAREVRAAAPGRELIALTGLTLEELRQRVRTLPEDTVVIVVGFMQDAAGQSLVTRDVTRLLHADGSPPLFSVHGTMLGSGIVGGMLMDYGLLGEDVARRALRVLRGEPLSSLPSGALESNQLAFDDRELARLGIPTRRLPPGSVVRFHEPGLWERYRWQVTAFAAAGLLMLALIVVLLLERRRRMGAQRLNGVVLDSLPGSVAILDSGGGVLRANPAPSRIEGPDGLPASKHWVTGGAWLEPFREAVRAGHGGLKGVVELVEDVLTRRSHEGVVEFRGLTPGTWFELRARRLERSEGGAVVSLVDVTPRKRAEEEARQARDERAHLERVAAVGELGISIAHELNQPLAAIRTNAETAQRLLQRTPIDTVLLREVLQDIIADDQRAGEVIRHMRALLKKGQSQYAPHDFNELVSGVVRLVGTDAQLRGAKLTLHLFDAPLPVWGDNVQLQQVVLNLIINALDAVGDVPGDRQVWVSTFRQEGQVELVVEDTGVGLSEELLKRIFEPFFTTKQEGLGMGLSISRSILEVHRGRLQAEHRHAGRGALFRCTLPSA